MLWLAGSSCYHPRLQPGLHADECPFALDTKARVHLCLQRGDIDAAQQWKGTLETRQRSDEKLRQS